MPVMKPALVDRVPDPLASLVLLPSLGTTARVWDDALARIGPSRADVLRFDLPGHGSAVVRDDFDIEDLADEVAAYIATETAPGAPVIVAGVSMGGAIAVEVARRHPRVVDGFAAFSAALRFGTPAGWNELIGRVRAAGTPGFDREGTLAGWFTPAYSGGAGEARSAQILDELVGIDPDGYIECCRALARYDATTGVPSLSAPGAAIAGTADRAVPPVTTRAIAASGGHITYRELRGAHLAIVEDAAGAARILRESILRAASADR